MFAVGLGKKDQARAREAKLAKENDSVFANTGLSTSISMYANAPADDVELEEFELYALDRIKLLKAIDDGLSTGKKGPEIKTLIDSKMREYGLQTGRDYDIRKDEVSHFALRMAYCRTDELRRWFLQNECTLFKHKFDGMAPNQKAAFLKTHDMGYQLSLIHI